MVVIFCGACLLAKSLLSSNFLNGVSNMRSPGDSVVTSYVPSLLKSPISSGESYLIIITRAHLSTLHKANLTSIATIDLVEVEGAHRLETYKPTFEVKPNTGVKRLCNLN